VIPADLRDAFKASRENRTTGPLGCWGNLPAAMLLPVCLAAAAIASVGAEMAIHRNWRKTAWGRALTHRGFVPG